MADVGRAGAELWGAEIPLENRINFIKGNLALLVVDKLRELAAIIGVPLGSREKKSDILHKMAFVIDKFHYLPNTSLTDPLANVFKCTHHLQNVSYEEVRQFGPYLGTLGKDILIRILTMIGPVSRILLFSQSKHLIKYKTDFIVDKRISCFFKDITQIMVRDSPKWKAFKPRNSLVSNDGKKYYIITSDYNAWVSKLHIKGVVLQSMML